MLPDEVIDNGHFGAYTEKLVKGFQEKCGLTPNGIIEEQFLQHLKSSFVVYYLKINFLDEIIKKKNTNPNYEKRKKLLEAEELKKIKISQQTLESTQILNEMESKILNELY